MAESGLGCPNTAMHMDSDLYLPFHNIRLINSRLISPRLRKIIASGEYEYPEIKLALEQIRPDDVVLELGAGIGALSCMIMKNAPAASYICVEANPGLAPLIRKNHKINEIKNCEVLTGVMSNDENLSEADFFITEDFWASSLTHPAQFAEAKKVPVYLFNNILQKYRPSCLICDIEGGEFELFKPGVDFSGVSTVIMEVHNPGSIEPLKQLDAFLQSFGLFLQNPPFRPDILLFKRQLV